MADMGSVQKFSPYAMFGVEPMTTSTSDILAKAYQANAEKQITKQQQLIADRSQVEMDAATREMRRWMPLTEGMTAAQGSISDAQSQVKALDGFLFKMIGTLNTPSDGDWTKAAAKFNGLLSALNSAGNNSSPDNLLGTSRRGDSYKANQVEYQISPDPRDRTIIFGKYVGSDFKLNLPDGTFWMPSGSQQIQQYSSFPNGKIGYVQSTTNGATKLDSAFNAASLTFSVGNTVQAPQSYTGSLQREGLGVLQSWLYDGLSTAAGRARALEDIQHARNILKSVGSSLDTAMAQVSGDMVRVQSRIDEQQQILTRISDDANQQVQTYVAKAQAEVQQQLTAAANVEATPVVQLIKVGGRIGKLFDLLT